LRPNPEIKESGIVVALTAKKGQSRPSFRFRGRSFMAFVLAPELPLHDWMAELDSQLHRSERFFFADPSFSIYRDACARRSNHRS
jgi:hypothetical protein